MDSLNIVSAEQRPLLTPMQSRVFYILSLPEGLSCEEIGRRLGCSPRTVESHRENIRQRLGLANGRAVGIRGAEIRAAAEEREREKRDCSRIANRADTGIID
jgi:DNA-binding CsgD family transcriptional regulator